MTSEFNTQLYGASVARLLEDAPLSEIGPGEPVLEAETRLSALQPASVCEPKPIADPTMAACCLAGLWLRYDFLDQSHRLSQDIETPTGSYWHGIMHRREPDFSNSKYWFRRVGEHDIFPSLHQSAQQLARSSQLDGEAEFLAEQARWDPFRFVDFCEAIVRGRSSCGQLGRQVAQLEWQLLFDFCYQRAVGA